MVGATTAGLIVRAPRPTRANERVLREAAGATSVDTSANSAQAGAMVTRAWSRVANYDVPKKQERIVY